MNSNLLHTVRGDGSQVIGVVLGVSDECGP
jgi:hypothetical protein